MESKKNTNKQNVWLRLSEKEEYLRNGVNNQGKDSFGLELAKTLLSLEINPKNKALSSSLVTAIVANSGPRPTLGWSYSLI